MSQVTESRDPLSTDGEYSGMLYWIATPSGYELNLENLRQHLDEQIFSEDITNEIDDDTEVPQVFKEDGRVVRRTSIYNAKSIDSSYGKVISAEVKMDRDDTVSYRDQQILTMDAYVAKMLIFEREGVNYLLVVASRKVSTDVADMLRKKYEELGNLINNTRLPGPSLKNIVDNLDAALVDTILSEFPEENVENIEWTGEDYGDHPDFEKHEERGETQNHMFGTRELVGEDAVTIRIANDGLVRIYNKSPLDTYLRLITEYIIPNVHRDTTGSSSLETFTDSSENPILEEV